MEFAGSCGLFYVQTQFHTIFRKYLVNPNHFSLKNNFSLSCEMRLRMHFILKLGKLSRPKLQYTIMAQRCPNELCCTQSQPD